MEIITFGSRPKIHITLQSQSFKELNNALLDLDRELRRKGYLTIEDLYRVTLDRACPNPSSFLNIGWYDDIRFSHGRIVQNRSLHNDCVFYRCECPTTVDLMEDSEIRIKFKPALPIAAKDEKIQKAYNALTKEYCNSGGTMADLEHAVEKAIGYLGEVLE